MLQVYIQRDFESWRAAARRLLRDGVEPQGIFWAETDSSEPTLEFDVASEKAASERAEAGTRPQAVSPEGELRVPREFIAAATLAACHRDPSRWELLYRLLWRITHGERELMSVPTDDDVRKAIMLERAVSRDRHKMTAFVRFRKVESVDPPEAAEGSAPVEPFYVAWHRPDHYIVRLTAPFFRKRFASMKWAILTPDESASWDGSTLRFGEGVPRSEAPREDELESLWLTYYANIFNPARVKVAAMKRELPVRHWSTLPETQIIPDLLRDAPRRVEEMVRRAASIARPSDPGLLMPMAAKGKPRESDEPGACDTDATSAAAFVPEGRSLPVLREAAAGCKGCSLYCAATQTVFGEGPAGAKVMLIGEQPGDQEDLAGRPFVGPAGQLLNEALREAGLPRDACYVTNAVKHFKFEPRGKRRIHSKPSAREVDACRPWLESEIDALKPKMIVCLGATAAQALMGRDFRITASRGKVFATDWAPWLMATLHPSALLRIPDPDRRKEMHAHFIEDLRTAAAQLRKVA